MTPCAACALGVAATIGGGLAPAGEPLPLPHTIASVWYRTDTERGAFGPKHEGDLRITAEALEFSARKVDLVIPLAELRIVSFGPMGSDFDTDWVVIGTDHDGARGLLGLRDGRRLGYGGRTPDIFSTLLRVAREHGVAQFAAPEGLEPYTRFDRQIALIIPQGWGAVQHGVARIDKVGMTGTILFSADVPPERARPGEGLPDDVRAEVVRRARAGESQVWILEILKARSGQRCSGFTDKGRAALLGSIASSELLGLGLHGPQGGALAPAPVDRCAGVAGLWTGSAGGGPEVVVDLRAASDDDFVYVLALRASADRAAADRPLFERGVGGVRFAVARSLRSSAP